jgi:nicotinate phosphoribosyltransferase
LVNAGLADVLDFLESFRFDDHDLDYLDSTGMFPQDFLDYLSSLEFSGDVWAMPEGRVFFKDEPILEVTGPMIEAQLVETMILNIINLQVVIATKASRCVHASQGRNLVDFSLRRTQGTDAGLKVARASYIAGFGATSNVLAGKRYGIPISGTMAHSYVTSFEEEIDAFRAFAELFPDNTVLLVDTYDTLTGARKAVTVGKEMSTRGAHLKGVRLDSGDMAKLSREVRRLFREEGLEDVSIFASGGFDEYKIARVLEEGAEIDAFGVGTKMGVSADGPYTDIAYKLVQYDGRPVLKLSSGKKTLVGEKQVFRRTNNGRFAGDVIGLRDEDLDGEPLLSMVMEQGQRKQKSESLDDIRKRFHDDFAALDESSKALDHPKSYAVELGPGLKSLQDEVSHRVIEKELGES